MPGQPGRVVIVGAGPAGMALGYLLARRGVAVTVLEAHHDFARAFRGEGLQRSGIDVFRQTGLGEQFDRLPHVERGVRAERRSRIRCGRPVEPLDRRVGVYGEAVGGSSGSHGVAALTSGPGAAILATNYSGPALELHSTGTPMTVDSQVKVDNLNADMLDGLHASAFLPANGKAADANKLDGLDSTQFVVGDGGRGGLLMADNI